MQNAAGTFLVGIKDELVLLGSLVKKATMGVQAID